MTTESDVTIVMNVIKYKDAVLNKITLTSAAIGNGTVNYLLQTPKNDNIFVPLISSSSPTRKPSLSPSVKPAVVLTPFTSTPSKFPSSSSGPGLTIKISVYFYNNII